VKPFTPKRFPWAGLLASAFTILSGFVLCLFVITAFSDTQARGIAFVVIVFAVIILVPFTAMRAPRDPKEKKERRWWMFWRRRRTKKELEGRYWKRKRGQEKNLPFGHREVTPTSTFVAAPRKPTEP
jgi:hypothetical protein